MRSKLKVIVIFLVAVIVTIIAASLAHTQFVLAGLTELGISISLGERLSTTLVDLAGLAPTYGTIILIGSIIGYSVMGWVGGKLSMPFAIRFVIAGVLTMLAIHLAMHPLMNITLIAGARTTMGLVAQLIAAAIGGLVFASLLPWTKKPNAA